jgi:UDP-GlcNAc:undecaprenyl-phosphate GlcNAc-1-phosphate transferase
MYLAKRWKLIDDKTTRFHPAQVHTGAIPRAGGASLLLAIAIPFLLFLPHTLLYFSILISSALLVIVGLFDDKKDVHPYIRLLTNAIAAVLVIAAGIRIPFITNPFGDGVIIPVDVVSLIISFIWIYWTMNIVGWSAGVDGQLPGVVSIAAFVLGILSLRYSIPDPSQLPVTILSFIVAGAFLGFLPWNFYPQKIMPGYGGKTLAGFLLAVLGILSYAKVGTALLVLGIPMIDAMYIVIRRISKGKSPVWADRNHLHHHLLDLGWSKRMIALCYYFVSAILGAIALSVTRAQKLFVFLLVAVAIGGFLLWVHWVLKFSKQQDQDSG